MNIEDRAHEILLKLIETDKTGFDAEGIAGYAYEIAEAMQAEAERRKAAQNANPMRKVREAEWKPDWSQAPDWAVAWTTDKCESLWWNETPVVNGNFWFKDSATWKCKLAPSFNYQGDWKDSLRKRP